MTTPPWMIEELERSRRERELPERPVLHVDVPDEPQRRRDPDAHPPAPRGVIIIEL
jgi:hypothetical protein